MKPGEGVEESLLARVQELRQENERLRAALDNIEYLLEECSLSGGWSRDLDDALVIVDQALRPDLPVPSDDARP